MLQMQRQTQLKILDGGIYITKFANTAYQFAKNMAIAWQEKLSVLMERQEIHFAVIPIVPTAYGN